MSTPRARSWWWLAALALLGLAAGGYAHWLARDGLIVSPDSLVYDGVAHNLSNGRGLTVPFTTVAVDLPPSEAPRLVGEVPLVQFPPLFPLTLSALGWFGLEPEEAARLLNPSLFGLNLFLIGLLVTSVVGRRRWAWSIPVMALLAVPLLRFERSPLLQLHGSVLSEPLLVTFALTSVLTLDQALRRRSQWWLFAAALLASAATATRFVGVASVVCTASAVLLWWGGSRGRRALLALGTALIGTVPTMLAVAVATNRMGGRGHPPTFGSVSDASRQLATGIAQWLVPTTATTVVRVSILLGAPLVLAVAAGHQVPVQLVGSAEAARRRTRKLVALLTLTYLTVVMASRLTFDQNVALWGRHLELAWVLSLVLVVGLLSSTTLGRREHRGLLLCAAVLLVAVAWPGVTDLQRISEVGFRPPLEAARTTGLARALRSVPARVVVFSDAPDGIYATAARPAFMVPCRRNYYTHEPNDHYAEDVADLLLLVRSGRAVLAVGNTSLVGRGACLDAGDAVDLGLVRSATWPGGALYVEGG